MTTPIWDVLLPLYLGSIYLFVVLVTAFLGRKSNVPLGWILVVSFLFTPLAGMVLLLFAGERISSYEKIQRLIQLREQGILTEEEFEWKFRPPTQEILLRELALLRKEGVLSYREYRAKVRKIKSQSQHVPA